MADKIIVLNLGTTSFKCKLFDFARGERAIASCAVERVGAAAPSPWQFKASDARQDGLAPCRDHAAAFHLCIGLLQDHGLIRSLDDLDGAGFKTVHGGPISGAVPVDDAVLAVLDEYAAFAPAHNPMYAALMRQLRAKHPALSQVACFETAFHAGMPAYRATYGVPYAWMTKYGVRRYGFHGASHSYIAAKMRDRVASQDNEMRKLRESLKKMQEQSALLRQEIADAKAEREKKAAAAKEIAQAKASAPPAAPAVPVAPFATAPGGGSRSRRCTVRASSEASSQGSCRARSSHLM